MRLASVNVSSIQTITHGGKTIRTGIFKVPVAQPVPVGRLGLEGDEQADLRYHGGIDKAVYAYPLEHYNTWGQELDRTDLRPGQFGENLTTEGLLEPEVCIGDRYRVGTALLEVTQPRVPCQKLAIKMGLPHFPKAFLESGRSGFYLRVLEDGVVTAGDAITLEYRPDSKLTVSRINRVKFFEKDDTGLMARALAEPGLADIWRADFATILEKAEAQ